MKNVIYLIVAFLMINEAKSQKSRFGVTIGTTVSSYKVKIESVSATSKKKIGLTLGISSQIPLGKNLSFQPALNYVQKGGKINEDGTKDKLSTHFLEVPLNLAFNLLSQNSSFFIGAGPSFSLGLWGKDEWESEGISESTDVKFGKDSDKDFKSLEAGINFITGISLKSGIIITANYNTSITNPMHSIGGFSQKFYNRYFGIRLGYMLH